LDEGHSYEARFGRIDTELSGFRQEIGGFRQEMGVFSADMSGMKADMKAFGGILGRIESGVKDAQRQQQEEKSASRINPIALASVLVAIISTLVGGAWVIGGQLSRFDERSVQQQKLNDRTEQRLWDSLQREGKERAPRSSAPATPA
jgi:hypothetical protein